MPGYTGNTVGSALLAVTDVNALDLEIAIAASCRSCCPWRRGRYTKLSEPWW